MSASLMGFVLSFVNQLIQFNEISIKQHTITSDRTIDYDKVIGGLTRQIPHMARLLTEETLPGSLGLASEVEGFAFQVPEAWAGNKSSNFQHKTFQNQ